MATMSGSKGGKKGRLMSVNVEIKGNGFEVTKRYEPVMDRKKGYPIYEPEGIKDSMVFTEPGACLVYLEKCLGEREHAAHEAAEKKEGEY